MCFEILEVALASDCEGFAVLSVSKASAILREKERCTLVFAYPNVDYT